MGGFSPLPGSKTRKKDAEKCDLTVVYWYRSNSSVQITPPVCRHVWSCSRVPPKSPGYVWPTGMGKSEGWRTPKVPLASRVLIQPPLNPELPGMWWEDSAAAAELACTIVLFLPPIAAPDSGFRRRRNCEPGIWWPDSSSGQGLLLPGLCTTFPRQNKSATSR